MRYVIVRDGEEIPVVVEKRNNGYVATLGDKTYEVDSRFILPGLYSLIIDGQSYEVSVYSPETDVYNVYLHDGMRRVELLSPMALVMRAHGGVSGGQALSVKAPMPGKVVRILVSPGQKVKKGQGVVVVEAMKMQNELQALSDGVVKAIKVKEGDGVEGGAELVVLNKSDMRK